MCKNCMVCVFCKSHTLETVFIGSLLLKDIGVIMQLTLGECLLMEKPGSIGRNWLSKTCASAHRAFCQQSVCKDLFLLEFCKHNYRVLV